MQTEPIHLLHSQVLPPITTLNFVWHVRASSVGALPRVGESFTVRVTMSSVSMMPGAGRERTETTLTYDVLAARLLDALRAHGTTPDPAANH